MSTSRIDELRSKFEENPRRYFAPLANEYRKLGDLTSAIALCREHLPKQPGHMSGHIVFGQALFEAGELAESQQIFEAAIQLDPENLIALRHLVDIARSNGDSRMARRWYERMLDVDPHNDEIAHQLSSLVTPAVNHYVVPEPQYGFGGEKADDTGGEPEHELVDIDAIGGVSADAISDVAAVSDVAAAVDEPTSLQDSDIDVRDIDFSSMPTPPLGFDATVFAPLNTPDAALSAIDGLEDVEQVVADANAFGDNDVDAVSDGISTELDEVVSNSVVVAGDAFDDAFSDADAGFDSVNGELPEYDFDTPSGGSVESIDINDAVFAFSAHDPAREINPLVGGTPTAAADIETPVSLSSLEAQAEFEEGLVAPDWTDASVLASRLASPPAVDAVTPIYSEAVVEAFGRESSDPELVLPPEEAEFGEREVEAVEHYAENVVEHHAEDVVEHYVEDVVQPKAESVIEHVDLDAEVIQNDDEIDNDIDDGADNDVDGSSSEVDIPWIEAAADTPVEVQEVARALSLDARASGENAAIRVETHDGNSDIVWSRDSLTSHDEVAYQGTSQDTVSELPVTESAEVDAFAISSDLDATFESAAVNPADVVSNDVVSAGDASSDVASNDVASNDVASNDVVSAGEINAEPETELQVAEVATLKGETPAFYTETMAELLVSQGFATRAIEVYEELVRRRPYDEVLVSRLAELRAGEAEAQLPKALSATEEHENARTARERFSDLALRRVPRRTPPRAAVAIEEPAESLSTRADGLAGLFGAPETTSQDDYAARMLADAFETVDTQPVMRVSDETPIVVTRTVTAPSLQAVDPVKAPTATPTKSFSFDRFFPDPATVKAQSHTPVSPSLASGLSKTTNPSGVQSVSPPPQVNDDLAEFAAWLKGLDKQ